VQTIESGRIEMRRVESGRVDRVGVQVVQVLYWFYRAGTPSDSERATSTNHWLVEWSARRPRLTRYR
jgi:hypothetical protein